MSEKTEHCELTETDKRMLDALRQSGLDAARESFFAGKKLVCFKEALFVVLLRNFAFKDW